MTQNSHEYEYNNLRAHHPLMSYKDDCDFFEWRDACREKLSELLGFPLNICEPHLMLEYKQIREDHTDYRFTVETEPGYAVPCHLLVPNGEDSRIPLTLCLSGHGGGMHIALGVAKTDKDKEALDEWHHRAMGLRAVNDGRCALVIEARSFGEASVNGYGISCAEAAKNAILMGRCTVGERVWDAMRVLDAVLDMFDFIDRDNIVCTGNSGGGTVTYYLACIDERITAAAPSCSICGYEDSIAAMPHCLCNHIPGIRKYFEMGDLAGLIAPRRLVIAAGKRDDIFPIDGTLKCFEKIRSIYDRAGVPDNCALVIGERGHYNYADLLWAKLHEMGI